MGARRIAGSISLLLLTAACPATEPSTVAGTTGQCFAPCDTDGSMGTADTAGTLDGTGDGDGSLEGGELPPGTECQSDADCVLDDDCCHCNVYPGQLPADHVCDQGLCEQSGCQQVAGAAIDRAATCANGNCRLAKHDCDPAHVTCDAPTPECDPLMRPLVIDGCWGPCVFRGACEGHLYPGAECPEGYTTVAYYVCSGNTCEGGGFECLPDIEGCDTFDDPDPDCECGFDAICAAQGFDCYRAGGQIECCIGGPDACGP